MFVILESTEGAGKGTLVEYLRIMGRLYDKEWVFTREPGGTPEGEKLRELIIDNNSTFCADEEIYLLAVARKRHLERVIKPAIAEGKVVFCERWVPTTIAYQAYARSHRDENRSESFERLLSLILDTTNHLGIMDFPVDLAILLDIDPVIGQARIASRGSLDRIESEPISFFNAVRQGYHDVLLEGKYFTPRNVRTIDASKSINDVKAAADRILKEFNLL